MTHFATLYLPRQLPPEAVSGPLVDDMMVVVPLNSSPLKSVGPRVLTSTVLHDVIQESPWGHWIYSPKDARIQLSPHSMSF